MASCCEFFSDGFSESAGGAGNDAVHIVVFCRMQYKQLFFDLDHTLWDFEANSRQTLAALYDSLGLEEKGVNDFDLFHKHYLAHNEKLWERYRNGTIKADELRWKRMWLTLMEFKIGDEKLAREMAVLFLDLLPTRKLLFPYTLEILEYLRSKGYQVTPDHQRVREDAAQQVGACGDVGLFQGGDHVGRRGKSEAA